MALGWRRLVVRVVVWGVRHVVVVAVMGAWRWWAEMGVGGESRVGGGGG